MFAQFVEFLNNDKFRRIVGKCKGDKYVKHFTCWNQLLVLLFGQLCNRESLRDLVCALDAHHNKCYHLGFGTNVSKTNLAYANQVRNCHIFEEFAYYVVEEARRARATVIFNLDGHVYAFDSTTIDLCLSVFWWATFRKHKGGVKVHTLYDVETQIPAFFLVTAASVHDVNATDGNHRGFIYYNLSIHDDDRVSSTQVNSYSLCEHSLWCFSFDYSYSIRGTSSFVLTWRRYRRAHRNGRYYRCRPDQSTHLAPRCHPDGLLYAG